MSDVLGISGYVGRVQVVIHPSESVPCSLLAREGRVGRTEWEFPGLFLGCWKVNGTNDGKEELPRQSWCCFPGTATVTHGLRSQVCCRDIVWRLCSSDLNALLLSQKGFFGSLPLLLL